MAKTPSVPPEALALYEKLVASNPEVDRKGAATPYTSRNGHMFSFLTRTGTLALRLPEDEREAFLKKHRSKLCVQHGVVMKEYVEVPASLLKRTDALKPWFDLSWSYVGSLKPKPTTRKKKATGKAKGAKKKAAAKARAKAKRPAKKKNKSR